MEPEVRYHMLRPAQIVAQRTDCPVAYIPVGTLEWHGEHNALGADTLQAEGLAILCAQRAGGLVFPPLYYGESRLEALMEANAADREQIAELMALDPENFTPRYQPFSATEQALNYQRLLLHILAEAETLGMRLAVLVAGHYPLIDHARAAVLLFNQRRGSLGMRAWACVDYLLVRDRYPYSGDHAGGWETSHMMALHPETVDLTTLPPPGEHAVGVGTGGRYDPRDSTAEFGQEILDAAAETVIQEVQHRLAHPELYQGHGRCLSEGLWREEK
ncbi:MAG: creatininase family protein [Armatimonadota bacterium]